MGIGAYFSIALILTASTPFPIFYKDLYLIDLFQKRQTPKIIPLLLILLIFWHTTGIISRQVEMLAIIFKS